MNISGKKCFFFLTITSVSKQLLVIFCCVQAAKERAVAEEQARQKQRQEDWLKGFMKLAKALYALDENNSGTRNH